MRPGIPLKTPDGILPDSRSPAARGATLGPGGYWVPIYCANCGAEGGVVPEATTTVAFYLCDNCFEEHGTVAGLLAVPDELVFRELREAQKEELRRQGIR